MRSQVQVLAGPPSITAGHSAGGSEPGALAACLGRAGAARPPPPARPLAPPGPPTRPSGSAATTHRGRAPSPGRQPRGGCGHLAPQPAPAPTAQPQRQVLRTPAWPAWSLSGHTRPPPHPPGQAPATPLTNVRPRQRRRPKPAGPSTERLDGTAATGTSTASCGDGCPRGTSLVPTPPSSVGGDGRVRTDGWTADGWTPDGWTLDGGHQRAGRVDSRRAGQPDPGQRPQVTEHRTGWTPDGRTAGPRTTPDGWLDTACWTPTGDRRHGRRPGSVDHGDARRWMPAGGSAGQMPSG
jgi:hypothetical protein